MNIGRKLQDEVGDLLPQNFAEQFRDLQSNVELIKVHNEEMLIRIKGVESAAKRIEKKVDGLYDKLDDILSKLNQG